MPFQVSPGVNVSEIDFSTSTPNVSASVGGLVGRFTQGPVNTITKISSEQELTSLFGKPNEDTYKSYFSASNFLQYGNNLSLIRVVGTGALNATAGIPQTNTPVESTITGTAFAAVVASGGSGTTDGAVGTGDAAVTGEALGTADNSTTVFTLPTTAHTNRSITVKVDGATVAANTFTLSGTNTVTFATAPVSGAITVDFTAADTFTLPREDFNSDIAVSVGGSSVTSGFTVTGTSLVFASGSIPADGDAVTVTMGARKKFALTGEDVGASDSVTVDDATTGFTVTGATATTKVVEMTTAPASDITIKVLNATQTTFSYTGVLVTHEEEGANDIAAAAAAVNGEWAAKSAGVWGNNLKVYTIDSATNLTAFEALNTNFQNVISAAPNVASTDGLTSAEAGRSIELHVVVTQINPSNGVETVLETFEFLSKAGNGKRADGTNIYYRDVINEKSEYIWSINHPAIGTNWGTNLVTTVSGAEVATSFATIGSDALTRPFGGGNDGATPTAGQVTQSYDLFSDPDSTDVTLVMTGEWGDITSGSTVQTSVISMCETRKDAVALISPPTSTVLGNNPLSGVVTYFDTTMTQKSNYAFVDSNVKYQYDKYNDKYRWLPLNGDIAGLMARTDNDRDPWFSPAGFNRGVIKNSVKLGWDQTKVHRDTIYPKAINPVVTFPGQGTVLYGDRTHTTKPSAFDRINVRRLFIILEKSIATAAKFTLFEFNDAFTRSQFTALVEPFLREVKGRRGIYDFLVVCDETNNTPAVVDANEFVGDIFIKPARSINYIQLNFIATRTGTEFEEIVGSA